MNATVIQSTTIKIDASINDRVKLLTDARHRTLHCVMVDAIREYVEREEKREVFRQQGIRAWDEPKIRTSARRLRRISCTYAR